MGSQRPAGAGSGGAAAQEVRSAHAPVRAAAGVGPEGPVPGGARSRGRSVRAARLGSCTAAIKYFSEEVGKVDVAHVFHVNRELSFLAQDHRAGV